MRPRAWFCFQINRLMKYYSNPGSITARIIKGLHSGAFAKC